MLAQGQYNINLLKHCTSPAWAALLHLLTVEHRRLAVASGYKCVPVVVGTL